MKNNCRLEFNRKKSRIPYTLETRLIEAVIHFAWTTLKNLLSRSERYNLYYLMFEPKEANSTLFWVCLIHQ